MRRPAAAALAALLLLSAPAAFAGDGYKVRVPLPGITWARSGLTAREAVLELKGVLSVVVDLERKEAVAVLDGTGARSEDVEKALAAAGFAAGKAEIVEELPLPPESPGGPP